MNHTRKFKNNPGDSLFVKIVVEYSIIEHFTMCQNTKKDRIF